jgi:hypothetical protein
MGYVDVISALYGWFEGVARRKRRQNTGGAADSSADVTLLHSIQTTWEIITFGMFDHHCIPAGGVRFVSGHRFSDDARAQESRLQALGLNVDSLRNADRSHLIASESTFFVTFSTC